jgi:uncharacterized membrane protein
MKTPIYDKCCCCFSLVGGTVFLGWLNVIGGVLSLISSIVYLIDIDGLLAVFNDEALMTPDEFETFRTCK